jgi:MFS-type transporter involved in bile tolerance (Atg22 family)
MLFGLAETTLVAFLVCPLLLLSGPIIPYTRTILSSCVPQHQQAQIFSAFSALESIGTLFSPVFNAIYSYTVLSGNSWMVFEVMGLLSAISYMLICIAIYIDDIRGNLPDQSAYLKRLRMSEFDGNTSKNRKISIVA